MKSLLSTTELGCVVDGLRLFGDLNIDLKAGELLEVSGPNGCGKSTLLRCLAGVKEPTQGSITRNIEDCAYLGHQLGLNQLLSVKENLRFFASLSVAQQLNNRVDEACGLFGLRKVQNQLVSRLSAGLQQRAALAKIWIQGKSIWLLDEPRSALDRSGHELLHEILGQHRANGGALVVVAHSPLELENKVFLQLGA